MRLHRILTKEDDRRPSAGIGLDEPREASIAGQDDARLESCEAKKLTDGQIRGADLDRVHRVISRFVQSLDDRLRKKGVRQYLQTIIR